MQHSARKKEKKKKRLPGIKGVKAVFLRKESARRAARKFWGEKANDPCVRKKKKTISIVKMQWYERNKFILRRSFDFNRERPGPTR